MKQGPVNNLPKRNAATWKKFDGDVVSANYDGIFILPVVGWFGTIQNLYFGCLNHNLIFSLIATFYLKKMKTELKNL